MALKLTGGFDRNGMRPHRRNRSSFRRKLSFLLSSIGDQLYYIGLVIERTIHRTERSIRHGIIRFFKFVGRLIVQVAKLISRFAVLIAKDIARPFYKIYIGTRSYFELLDYSKEWPKAKRRRAIRNFFEGGFNRNKYAVARFLNSFLPICGAVVFLFTIYSLFNLQFGLNVTYNGQHIGYVPSEISFDSAQKVIQDRIIDDDDDYVWTADNAELTIAVVSADDISSETEIADALISASGTEITEATGLYIGGEFYGATVAGNLLDDLIDSIIQPYIDAAADEEDTTVKFTRNVELVEGVYPSSSVLAFSEIEKIANSTETSDIYHTVKGNDTLEYIASENGITMDTLLSLNPGVEGNYDIEEGDSLLVSQGEPLLAVKTVKIETYTEDIDYDTEVVEDGRFYYGYSRTLVEGQKGEKTITVEVEYENGTEVAREVVNEEISVEPTTRKLIRGTKSYNALGGQVVGTGVLGWPSGSGYFISRGWSATHHGIDIAAPLNTGLYAADSGTVIVSQWTNVGYGYYIIIDHGNGISTLYGHCNQLLVSVGEYVYRGQLIALMGSTGNSTGSHLHFEVRINGTKVDPAPYIY